MTLATLGWAVIWVAVCLVRWTPDWAPNPRIIFGSASLFAILGLGLGFFTLRAKLAWILITAAPIFANASLLSLEYVLPDLLERKEESVSSVLGGALELSAPAVVKPSSAQAVTHILGQRRP